MFFLSKSRRKLYSKTKQTTIQQLNPNIHTTEHNTIKKNEENLLQSRPFTATDVFPNQIYFSLVDMMMTSLFQISYDEDDDDESIFIILIGPACSRPLTRS